MAADEVTVIAQVGEPNGPVTMRVTRAQTITVPVSGDLEQYTIDAMRTVDELCQQVRAEALAQVKAIMERMKRQAAEAAEGIARR